MRPPFPSSHSPRLRHQPRPKDFLADLSTLFICHRPWDQQDDETLYCQSEEDGELLIRGAFFFSREGCPSCDCSRLSAQGRQADSPFPFF